MTPMKRLTGIGYLLALLAILAPAPRAQAPGTMLTMAAPHVDVFRPALAAQVFTLSATPAAGTSLMVYINGLLMLAGSDYTVSGTRLTFTAQTIEVGAVIQVWYWVAQT
jgi:hypothetical protein